MKNIKELFDGFDEEYERVEIDWGEPIEQEIIEELEDETLYLEAEKRMKVAETEGYLSSREVYAAFGITEEELKNVKVEL